MSIAAPSPSSLRFIPAHLDATQWPQLEPLYRQLLDRTLKCPNCLEKLILDRSELDAAAAEAQANLYIEMTCHTEDAGSKARYLKFVEEVDPRLKEVGFDLDRKIVESPHAKGLDRTRYGTLLRSIEREVKLFRKENVPLQTESTKLDQRYSEISGAMTVTFDGQERTLPQMARHLEEGDRARRESSWRVVAERRLRDRDAIDGIYDGLVQLRVRMAANAGYANFRDFQHDLLQRFDYTPADCETFHAAVERTCVPLARRMQERRRAALGLDTLRPWDLKVDVKGRAPLRPFVTAEELVERTSRVYHRMDGELATMFDSMRGGGCLDLDSRKGKAPGGYQYQRQLSRRPFIFMNAAGMHRDLTTMVHEAGHAFHSLLSKDDPVLAYRGSPMEFAEVASMSQELLTLPHLEEFFSEADAERARRELLEGVITMLPWIAQIDAFQHWVHLHPDHTRQDRTAAWLALEDRFGGAADWSGLEEVRASLWQRQLHLFGLPFYYIEYGIAQLGALQLWLAAGQDPAAALVAYKRALSLGGSRPLPELFAAAGLRLDFGPQMVQTLMDAVGRELDRLPD
jgi:oligoendopeptidase F